MIFLQDGDKSFATHWAAHRMKRVCHFSQSPKTMAKNEGLNDAAYIRTMLYEISGTWVEGEIITDCKNAYLAITKTTDPTDRRVRCEEVNKIRLVRGKSQLADLLTNPDAGQIQWFFFTSLRQETV